MKHYLSIVIINLVAFNALAQIPGRSVKEYTTKAGTSFHKGDTIFFALGTMPDGSYKYAYTPANYLVGLPQRAFTSTWNNNRVVVKDVRVQDANKRMAARTVVIVSPATGALNGCVDVESAEATGEITTPNNQKTSTKSTPGGSVADELLKLKSLLDAGAITQQEYDQQKGKLLKP